MYELDLDDRKTWRNYPEPYCPAWIKEKIRRLGGRHSSGHPFLRLVWMPKVTRFYGGKVIPYYINPAIDPIIRTVHRMIRYPKDAAGKNILGPGGKALEEVVFAQDLAHVHEILEEDKIHREGWIYCPEIRGEYICFQRFCVEEFIPIEIWEEMGFSSPGRWELDRYGEFEDPITHFVNPRCDILGPYPAPGRYEVMLVCEDKHFDDEGRQDGTTYRSPDIRLIDQCERAKKLRDNFSNTPLNRAFYLRERACSIEISRQKHWETEREEALDIVKGFAWRASDKLARVYGTDGDERRPRRNRYGNITKAPRPAEGGRKIRGTIN